MITVVILTYNEAIHIERAVENVRGWATDVFIVDSFSTDRTRALAEEAGARVFEHPFENYAAQREWALRELPYRTEWMLFLDADELLSKELKVEIPQTLPSTPEGVDGYFIKRRFYWMGRWLRHGGIYPTWLLRLVRHRRARCGSRIVNEHLEVDGDTGELQHDLLHVDLKPLSDWMAKHNTYSSMEAQELGHSLSRGKRVPLRFLWGSQQERRLWIRETIWVRLLPSQLRPLAYFLYAYVARLGFLDGRAGLMYHLLQGLFFRYLIEAKHQMVSRMESESVNPPGMFREALPPRPPDGTGEGVDPRTIPVST